MMSDEVCHKYVEPVAHVIVVAALSRRIAGASLLESRVYSRQCPTILLSSSRSGLSSEDASSSVTNSISNTKLDKQALLNNEFDDIEDLEGR